MKLLESHIIELVAPHSVRFKSVDLDLSALKPTEIAARTISSVISPGTELAAYRGTPPLRPMAIYPRVVGYCNAAEVIACGSAVTRVRIGDLVLTNQSHRSSFICSETKILALVPPGIEPSAAATAYLFQLGYNALFKGNVKKGNSVAVIGLGTLGISTAAIANVLGASVVAFSNQNIDPAKLALFGVKHLTEKSRGGSSGNASSTYQNFDVCVSTSNAWADWHLALSLPRKNGTICVLGFPGRGLPRADFNPLSSEYFYDRQLTILACGMTPDETEVSEGETFSLQENCRVILDWIVRGLLPANELISAVVPWRDITSVYERLKNPEPEFITAALTW